MVGATFTASLYKFAASLYKFLAILIEDNGFSNIKINMGTMETLKIVLQIHFYWGGIISINVRGILKIPRTP